MYLLLFLSFSLLRQYFLENLFESVLSGVESQAVPVTEVDHGQWHLPPLLGGHQGGQIDSLGPQFHPDHLPEEVGGYVSLVLLPEDLPVEGGGPDVDLSGSSGELTDGQQQPSSVLRSEDPHSSQVTGPDLLTDLQVVVAVVQEGLVVFPHVKTGQPELQHCGRHPQ